MAAVSLVVFYLIWFVFGVQGNLTQIHSYKNSCMCIPIYINSLFFSLHFEGMSSTMKFIRPHVDLMPENGTYIPPAVYFTQVRTTIVVSQICITYFIVVCIYMYMYMYMYVCICICICVIYVYVYCVCMATSCLVQWLHKPPYNDFTDPPYNHSTYNDVTIPPYKVKIKIIRHLFEQ